MQQPLEITFRDIPHSAAIEQDIREKADKLNQYASEIISCHVVVEQTQKHQHQGKLHNVRITLNLPSKNEIAVTRKQNEDLYVAIRDAFDSLIIKLKDTHQQLRGHVKNHPTLMQGKIVRLFNHDGFGFIENTDGGEYYFNRSNVVSPNFDRLKVGLDVHFIEVVGDDGLQAHRVSASKKKLQAA